MKNSGAVTDANAIITIPRQFQKALFKPFKGKDFILNIFDGNVADAENFMAILNDKAANLSDDFDGAECLALTSGMKSMISVNSKPLVKSFSFDR